MVSIVFPKAEVRASWEETLIEFKAKLGKNLKAIQTISILMSIIIS